MGKKKNKKDKLKHLQHATTEITGFIMEHPGGESIIWEKTSRKPVIIPLETFEALNNCLLKMSPPNYNVFMSVSEYSMKELTPDHPIDEPGSPTHLIIFCMKLIQTDQFNPLGVVQIDVKKNQTEQLVTVWKAFIQDLSLLGILVVATISPASELFHSVLSELTKNSNLHNHKGPIIYSVWPYKEIIHLYDYQNLMEQFQDTFVNRVDLFFLNPPEQIQEKCDESESLKYYSACWTDILDTLTSNNIKCIYTKDGLGPDISIFGRKFKHNYIKAADSVETATKSSTNRLMSLLDIYTKLCRFNIDMSISNLRDFYEKTEDFRIFLSSAKFRTIDMVHPDFKNNITYTLEDPSVESIQTEKSSFGLEEDEASNIMKIISDSIDQDNENEDFKGEPPRIWGHDYLGSNYRDFTCDQSPPPPPIESKIAKIAKEYFYPDAETYKQVMTEATGASLTHDPKETSENIRKYFDSLKKKHKKISKRKETNNHDSTKSLLVVQEYLACLRDKFKKQAQEIEEAIKSERNSEDHHSQITLDPEKIPGNEQNHFPNVSDSLQSKKNKSKPIKELLTQIEDGVKSEQLPQQTKEVSQSTNDIMLTAYETPKIFGHTCKSCEEGEGIKSDSYSKKEASHENEIAPVTLNGLSNGLSHASDLCYDENLETEDQSVEKKNYNGDYYLKQNSVFNNLITAKCANVSYGAIKNSEETRVCEEGDTTHNIKDLVQNDLKELKLTIKTLEETEQALSHKLECIQLNLKTKTVIDEPQEITADITYNSGSGLFSKSSGSVDSLVELVGSLKEEEPTLDLQQIVIPSKHQHAIPSKMKEEFVETDKETEVSLSDIGCPKPKALPIDELQGLMRKVYYSQDTESKKSDRELEEVNKRMNGAKKREVIAKIVKVTGQKVIDKDLKKYVCPKKQAVAAQTKPSSDDKTELTYNKTNSNTTSLDFMEGVEKFYSTVEPEYLHNQQSDGKNVIASCCRLPSTSTDSHFSLDAKARICLPHYTRFNRLSRSSSEGSLTEQYYRPQTEIRRPYKGSGKMKRLASRKKAIKKRGREKISAINDVTELKTEDALESYETIESSIVKSSSPKTDLTVTNVQEESFSSEEVEVEEIDYSLYRTSLVNQLNIICDEKKSYCDNLFQDNTSVSKLLELFPQNCESLRVTTDWLCTLKGYSKLADVLEKRKIEKIRPKALCLDHTRLYVALVKKLRNQVLHSLKDKTAKSFLDFECSFNILLTMSGVYIIKDTDREIEGKIGQESRV